MKCLIISSVTMKSAITPSFRGLTADIFPGVLPSIVLASSPTARTDFFPFVSSKIITESIEALNNYDAVNISVPSSDTAILVKNNFIDSILNKEEIFLSQTPQSFKYKIILEAHKNNNQKNASDDIQLVENLNVKCYNLIGSKSNIKITHQIDLEIAEGLIKNKKI